jgi:hypothetical protein
VGILCGSWISTVLTAYALVGGAIKVASEQVKVSQGRGRRRALLWVVDTHDRVTVGILDSRS